MKTAITRLVVSGASWLAVWQLMEQVYEIPHLARFGLAALVIFAWEMSSNITFRNLSGRGIKP